MAGNEPNQSAEEPEEVVYDPESSRYDLYECPDCDNAVLALGRDEPMERVTDVEVSVKLPDVKQVLLQAVGLPKAGLDICLCVIGEGPLSANEVAESLGYDRSTVTVISRHSRAGSASAIRTEPREGWGG